MSPLCPSCAITAERGAVHRRRCFAAHQQSPDDDGRLKLYLNATDGAFGGATDYAMLTKLYGASGNDT